ncbi:MAG TPA: MMPL family transporter, partial [Kofleriaceae bacterium]|nr:MMPL family transporter [Kofleriaceae bacterium]
MSDHLPPPNIGHTWIDWAMKRPRQVLWLMLGSTLVTVLVAVLPTFVPGGLGPLSKITIDVDPENMLERHEPARVYHDEAKQRFGLHDAVVVGLVNERHPAGAFNVKTLTNLHRLTEAAKNLPGVVTPDVLSLSTVDRMRNTGPGEVSFDWLMATPPRTETEAAAIRTSAERIPFLRGTLFAEDGKALVLYLPLTKKSFAHDVSTELQKLIATLDRGDDHIHIAGLPIAEETFGVEMFVQMAISAPLAMLVIFGLMWLFFRHIVVIFSPMIIAMVAVLATMGLLVATGHTIHIMSSMIPIFIMPIAVLDAVHIISDFFDRYDPKKDRKAQVGSVMKHLFTPMLFTSLTTAAGFGSLAMTPIPPVQVFGVFVAIGVMLAWVWTILFVPAYLILLSDERLAKFGMKARSGSDQEDRGYVWLDRMTHRRARLVLVVAALALGGAVFGMTRIKINDNPTRWFEADHPIRVADRELNAHFGGTYDAFLALTHEPAPYQAASYGAEVGKQLDGFRGAIRDELAALGKELGKDSAAAPAQLIEQQEQALRQTRTKATSPALRAAADAGPE